MEDKGRKTLDLIELFTEDVNDQYIIHIPHSSVLIPSVEGDSLKKVVYETVNNELNLLTDWYTDKIFDVVEISSLVFPYSRLFCDVERLVEDEPLESVGRGYFYTHTDNGSLLRANNDNKENIYENYYKPHHNKLLSLVESKLRSNGKVTIIDCHSFNNQPLKTDLDQNNNRPDICLGVDTYHTNQELIDKVYNLYTSHGYTVAINSPYVGTIVPLEYYSINPNVQSIMIEVNKKLYLYDDNSPKVDEIKVLNSIFRQLFN